MRASASRWRFAGAASVEPTQQKTNNALFCCRSVCFHGGGPMPCSPSRYRLTHVQHFVLDVLRSNPQISYDGMAEQAEIDRQTAMQAIRRLTRSYRVVKLDGRGRQPNRYLLTDRVFVCRPGYVPTRVVLTEAKRRALYEQW